MPAAVALALPRAFNAPREPGCRGCPEAKQVKMWRGPKGREINGAKLELQPGGLFLRSSNANDDA